MSSNRSLTHAWLSATLLVFAACSNGNDTGITVPSQVVRGNVQVSCTVNCEGRDNCDKATVFVSACASGKEDDCLAITPIDKKDGNTYLISLDGKGDDRVLRGARCEGAAESTEGLPVDLVFVIDTTGSMGSQIKGVVESINKFVNKLAEDNVDMRIGGIAFGDRAPLPSCVMPDAPFAPLTTNFGTGTESSTDSFNHWLGNLSAGHCGDGGGDGPENALDAIEFALGNDPDESDKFSADAFEWNRNSLKVMVVITDVNQHQASDNARIAHFDIEQVMADVTGNVVVHVVGPQFGCPGQRLLSNGCACNTRPNACDVGCECDPFCPDVACEDDTRAGVCDVPMSSCDVDCAAFNGSSCDKRPNMCDPDADDPSTVCADDLDCTGVSKPNTARQRRCEPRRQKPFADIADLAYSTGGAFTQLVSGGMLDLTSLPLTGVLTATERCEVDLPGKAESLRCVYRDKDGNEGEVTIRIK